MTAISAHCLLHTFRGGPTGWPAVTGRLTARQLAALTPAAAARPVTAGEADGALLAALLSPDARTLYDSVCGELGALPGLRRIETTPILRTVKRAGAAD
ncbi:hypothetical protein OG455_25495 [Kitasatospora sp. NBC_01287]|uniref:hypothetical protein n=1 Tax=Kitasatospora sp. NBC_01287 TaxID=2903573 RepID=UPI0022513008|nr:hypothetical protein [Kitasatospora sp. NBC_01287]MCX4748830.1 hypothetical protein [Kitasatospora sp. NBC_01287]